LIVTIFLMTIEPAKTMTAAPPSSVWPVDVV
jgi:hypothetical protein